MPRLHIKQQSFSFGTCDFLFYIKHQNQGSEIVFCLENVCRRLTALNALLRASVFSFKSLLVSFQTLSTQKSQSCVHQPLNVAYCC